MYRQQKNIYFDVLEQDMILSCLHLTSYFQLFTSMSLGVMFVCLVLNVNCTKHLSSSHCLSMSLNFKTSKDKIYSILYSYSYSSNGLLTFQQILPFYLNDCIYAFFIHEEEEDKYIIELT